MTDVIDLHKADLTIGRAKMAKLTPNSNEWWEVKHKITKYEIAYSQAANMANERYVKFFGGQGFPSFEELHFQMYKLLTEPYRNHKGQFRDGSKKGKVDMTPVNIDKEIEL